ncbi:ATP-binding cassette domain-containing protein [Arsukibacterium sp.]|uniref:ATP-binding cassette domain-containing protein n=1 Tax=Arsukibacterium sp. TaxID=1977258 RepID=UPI001BD29EFF|nr:ATP-binding cassette domain-containing protein [Arsukibacterium sp.]
MNPVSVIISQLQLTPAADAAYKQLLLQLLKPLLTLPTPAVIGISGAQGTGKSTLARALTELLVSRGIAAGSVSLDDYYLSQAQRQQLAQTIHPLLAQRGVPGTHDIQQAIRDAKAVLAGQPVALRQFDKVLDEPVAALPAQQLDLLIVEGWCLGIQPQAEADLAVPVNTMEALEDTVGQWRHYVNQQLAGAYADYWQLLKPLVWLQAPDWECICRWQAQQEQQLRQARGRGMSDNELARFMLPFQRLTLASWQQLPAIVTATVLLDQQHIPTLLAAD